ncbi:MAG: endolytic transglycosylase MltG [Rickettsiales bacterium]|nr:endolytic transglycosylase MltG [Rickettsiales bacterium]
MRIFLLLAIFLLTILFFPGPFKGDSSVIIQHGSLVKASETLEKENIVYNNLLFLIPAKIANYFKTLKAGEYIFTKHASIFHIINKMQSGDVVFYKISIPEGLTSTEIIKIIDSQIMLSGTILNTQNFTEGSFLPETYYFTRGEQKQLLLSRIRKAMDTSVDMLWKDRVQNPHLKTKNDLIILASIVEKEAKSNEDRKKIASVFLNRLKKGMKLQADPTVIYAITKGQYKLERNLFTKDLALNSPWNTYYTAGLPPSPIANPGIESLKAVSKPISTNYLYFVVNDCNGNHAFASNLPEHKKNVQLYRKLNCNF